MTIITIRFDKALSAETLAKQKVVKSFGYADGEWGGGLVNFIMWDNSNPDSPLLSIFTSLGVSLEPGNYVTFIDGAIKDIHGNTITRTTP
ncbi:hypothetical protein BRE01_29340 [Brevibacillus reuszeri]|uniref:Uncharacterized protein n=1 Tax=Brevibacillus reuszeri TaxID=54915 RepID=A0A0K9YJ76_9BACL|nr:hypothetical protein [Brevibacillus reuszeri]KNB68719.1 hypothetical protein ADS79_32665 [Brevibacillus reuszeri]MED1859013.1 hypothetical protein [Brevibacillus reuszeri]GED69232.1 hypothetical protein BRE01_29340 [Brevibacillus reuszeri]